MKKIIFVFIIILFLPLFILEMILYSYNGPTGKESDPPFFKYYNVDIHNPFFKKSSMENRDVYTPQRLYDYFRHANSFSSIKGSNTIRIFILGGSVAHDWTGPEALFFKDALEDLIPDKDFELINCGMDGYDSYRVSLLVEEVLNYKPDLIIVLSGNNETLRDPTKVNLTIYYLNKHLRRFWTYRNAQDALLRFLENMDPMTSRKRRKKLADYEANLKLILKMAEAKKVPVILSTLPVSLKDYPMVVNRPLDRQFFLASFLFEKGDYRDAIDEINRFLNTKPGDSCGFRLLGRIYEAKGDYEEAKKYYLKALDLSFGLGSPHASPASNKIVRKICIQEKAGLADLEAAFMNIARHGLTGREQFFDKCHWYPEYYSLVTETVLMEIMENDRIYYGIFDSDKYRSNSFLIPHDFPLLEVGIKNDPVIRNQIKTAVWDTVWRQTIGLEDILNEAAVECFKTVHFMNPEVLWKMKDSREDMKKMVLDKKQNLLLGKDHKDLDFEKGWLKVLYYIGETYRRLKLYDESLQYFNKAIAMDESYYSPYIGRALVYYALGERQKVKENIYKAESLSDAIEIICYKEILESQS